MISAILKPQPPSVPPYEPIALRSWVIGLTAAAILWLAAGLVFWLVF